MDNGSKWRWRDWRNLKENNKSYGEGRENIMRWWVENEKIEKVIK